MSARHESHVKIRGKRLLAQMALRGLSSAALARKAGVSPTTISGILTRSQRITPRTARRISEALWSVQIMPGLRAILDDDEVA